MRKKWFWAALLALPLTAIGGLVYAQTRGPAEGDRQPVPEAGYTCPLTGEELPCPNCCPLNQGK